MLEIQTIDDFLNLETGIREKILKNIKCKERLEQWLGTSKRKSDPNTRWIACQECDPVYKGYIQIRERNNADIHPSTIDKCLKFQWYSCNGYATQQEETINQIPRLRLIFDTGKAWHKVIQGYGKAGAWGPSYKDEVEFSRENNTAAAEFWLRGSADGIISHYIVPAIEGIGDVAVRLVHEYKSINKDGFDKLIKPKSDHVRQAMMYSMVFNVPIVVFLYFCKDNANIAEYCVGFDPSVWSGIETKIRRVQLYSHTKIDIPWDETSAIARPGECSSCGYKEICKPPCLQ